MKAPLTKREYIAAIALQGILAAIPKDELKYSFEQALPKLAVMYADELLIELDKAEIKYYTPDIKEFRIGFEYEMKERFGDGTVKTRLEWERAKWIKKIVTSPDDLPYIERTLTGQNSINLPPAIRAKEQSGGVIEQLQALHQVGQQYFQG